MPSGFPSDGQVGYRSRIIAFAVAWTLWILLLVAPAITTFGSWQVWDVGGRQLLLMSLLAIAVLALLLPRRAFIALTWPISWLGLVCIGADQMRNVNALELLVQWRTFSREDVASALPPYLLPMGLAALGLGVLAWVCCWNREPRYSPRRAAAGISLSLLAGLLLPGLAWSRAWPASGVLAVVSAVSGSSRFAGAIFPGSAIVNPRAPDARWNAQRGNDPGVPETYVLVIGESVRSDFLHECGGSKQSSLVTPVTAGALVACDVTAGADSTYASVPLLVSREMPGHAVRVSTDVTIAKAFEEAGFDTYWHSVQERFVAWPDAQHVSYAVGAASDRSALLPALKASLAGPARRRFIILHAYNAHVPYCSKYDPANAPFQVKCLTSLKLPEGDSLEMWQQSYANAVDASVRFLDEVIATLGQAPGRTFLVYTSDHAENLLDDRRQMFGHALRRPTRWDIAVPAVFWANDAWIASHENGWSTLARNTSRPLMHADIVPTLAGAAGISYDDPRRGPVNLLSAVAPERQRMIQDAVGSAVTWDALLQEAQ